MGREAACRVTYGKHASDGTAHLESNELSFKGTFKLHIPFAAIRAFEAKGGALRVSFSGGADRADRVETATFDLGPQAEKWALKIRYPKGRLEKLGVKPEHIVSVIGVDDDGFRAEIEGRAATVSIGRARQSSDLIVYGVKDTGALATLATLRERIVPAGAIWVVWPKGQKAIREDDVRKAAVGMGLVDVKVMSFSDTLSALKLVIPVAQRAAAQRRRAV